MGKSVEIKQAECADRQLNIKIFNLNLQEYTYLFRNEEMKLKYLDNRKRQIFKNRKVISMVFIFCMLLDLILATIERGVLEGVFYAASILILLISLIPLWCQSTLGIFTSATLISIYVIMTTVLQSMRLVERVRNIKEVACIENE
jgi:hypothetical protein